MTRLIQFRVQFKIADPFDLSQTRRRPLRKRKPRRYGSIYHGLAHGIMEEINSDNRCLTVAICRLLLVSVVNVATVALLDDFDFLSNFRNHQLRIADGATSRVSEMLRSVHLVKNATGCTDRPCRESRSPLARAWLHSMQNMHLMCVIVGIRIIYL